jgi:hypothetical protein
MLLTMAKKTKTPPDIHWLYEASVQNADTDLDFAKRVFSRHWKRMPLTLREDFCGTAKLACRWVQRNTMHQAWGIDFHQPTLDWHKAQRFRAHPGSTGAPASGLRRRARN